MDNLTYAAARIAPVRLGRYYVKEYLTSGGFACIHRAITRSGETLCAKIGRTPNDSLLHEFRVMQALQDNAMFGDRFVRVHYQGRHMTHSIMIMDLMGQSIDAHLDERYSDKCIAMIAIQILYRLESIHRQGLCHGDLKPANIVSGRGKNEKVLYLIDFAAAQYYIDPATLQHRTDGVVKQPQGSFFFKSHRRHRRLILTRKDDLESLAYTLAYLGNNTLPWLGEYNVQMIERLKRWTAEEKIFRDMHSVFHRFLSYVRDMQFNTTPDYQAIRKMFRDMLADGGIKVDYNFDWLQRR